MKLDTESGTHSGMDGQSRCCHKHLLLQGWCGLLTVAMVVMAAFLTSIKTKSTEDQDSTVNVSSTVNTFLSSRQSIGPFSYIQLIKDPHTDSWIESPKCDSCSLILDNDSIYCKKNSLYFINAQVTFSKKHDESRSVILIKKDSISGRITSLVEGTFLNTSEGTVWVAKIVRLKAGEHVIVNITGDILKENTFWGAFELR